MEKLGWHSLGTSFDCTCGVRHSLPIKACYVGTEAAAKLAEYAQAHCGTSGFVVSDENTRAASGEAPFEELTRRGKSLREFVFGADPVDATDSVGDELRDLAEGSDFIVAIGSGSLCDLAKYAGDKLQIPVLLYPTAASMNGYTSAIVALKVRGLKRTIPCTPAEAIFANPEIAATAPQRMVAAGVADFLSKCSSSTDWRMAHLLHGGYFCERPREFFEGTQEAILKAAPDIGKGNPEAVGVALEALLLSGCSMVIAGSSAPASGGEHLISHYLDMKSALYGTSHDLHGTQVGVATVHCLGLWEKILALDPRELDAEALLAAQPEPSLIDSAIDADWGAVAPEVHEQWNEKRVSDDQLRAEIKQFRELAPRLQQELAVDLLPAETVAEAIEQCGGPSSPEGLHVPMEEYQNALTRARYIRNRFTVLDLAAHLGVN